MSRIPVKTPVMVLQELTVKQGMSPPQYNIVYSVQGSHKNRFDYHVHVAGIIGKGTGPSKQISKHNAAMDALNQLSFLGIYNPEENPVADFNRGDKQSNNAPTLGSSEAVCESSLNYIMPLTELCAENKIPLPIFNEISNMGPPHAKVFTYQCTVSSIKTEGMGNTKKQAKHIAAKKMLERVKETLPEIALQEHTKDVTLTDKDQKVIIKYAEFADVVTDKGICVSQYIHTFSNLMNEKDVKYSDIEACLDQSTLDNLDTFLSKLELKYNFTQIQDTNSGGPCMVVLSVSTSTPCATVGVGQNEEIAKTQALELMFKYIKSVLKNSGDTSV